MHTKKGFSSYYFREYKDHNDILLKNIRVININVGYFIDKWYNLHKREEYFKKYKYIILLGMNKDEIRSIKGDDVMIKKVRNDVEKLNQNEDFYQLFTDEEDQDYLNNGLYSEGIEQGIEKLNIAKNLLKTDMSLKDIAASTGLSLDEINKLKD